MRPHRTSRGSDRQFGARPPEPHFQPRPPAPDLTAVTPTTSVSHPNAWAIDDKQRPHAPTLRDIGLESTTPGPLALMSIVAARGLVPAPRPAPSERAQDRITVARERLMRMQLLRPRAGRIEIGNIPAGCQSRNPEPRRRETHLAVPITRPSVPPTIPPDTGLGGCTQPPPGAPCVSPARASYLQASTPTSTPTLSLSGPHVCAR